MLSFLISTLLVRKVLEIVLIPQSFDHTLVIFQPDYRAASIASGPSNGTAFIMKLAL